MSRSWPSRIRIVAIVALLAWQAQPAAETAAFSQQLSDQAKSQLKERDRLRKESQTLGAQGKLADAITAAQATLAIERKVFAADDPDLALSLEWLAQLHLQKNDFPAATAARQEALQIVQKRFGEAHWKATDARLALDDVKLQASLTGKQRERLEQARRLNQNAVALYNQGKYAEAAALARRGLAIYKEVLGERHREFATSLKNLAAFLGSQGDFAAARPLSERALAIDKEVLGERHPGHAANLNNLAALRATQGDYAAARPLYERALAINKEALGERHPDYATSLNNLAVLLESQGDYAAARPLHERALAIKRDLLGECHADYAVSLNNLALLLKSQGDYAAARPLFERALAINKEVLGERHPDYATNLNNLAWLLRSHGDYAAARPLYERALAIRKEVLGERHPAYAGSLNNLALLLQSQGDYAAARPLYERALAITKDVLGERHPAYATGLNNLALLLESQRDYAAARPLFERALAIRKQALGEHHPDYATNLNNLALVLESQGDYVAACPLYERALAIRKEALGEHHPDYAASLSNLGFLAWARSDVAAADPLLTKALEIAEGNLDLAAAVQSERQQLATANSLRGLLDSYLSFSPLAKISARDLYRHVLAAKGTVLERQRRLRTQRRLHQASPGSEAAKRFDEYTETVTQLSAMALSVPDPKKAEKWKSRLEELSRRKDELEAELSRLDAGFRAAQKIATRTPEQLQATLPNTLTALVDFLVYTAYQPPAAGKGEFERELHVVAFVLRQGQPIARIELGPFAAILKAIANWRPLLMSPNPSTASGEPARALRHLIWEPLEPHLEGATSVLISPDGPIGLVPLAALPGKDPGRYLIEERSIALIPVPRMMGGVEPAGAGHTIALESRPVLLLAGDIDYDRQAEGATNRGEQRSAGVETRAGAQRDFGPLTSTGEEILEIRDSFEKRFPEAPHPQVLRGDQATEESIRQLAPKSRYLHFATHGYFAPASLRSALAPADSHTKRPGIDTLGGAGVSGYHPGLLSGIALAGANIRPTPIGHDDGILTALEVAELDLSSVELAVLSACETGLGEVAGGEGLLGLQRTFQVAGAHSVIASLWKVGDEPTLALMAGFYENLWRKNQSPAQALREAQLSILHGDLGRGGLKREDGPESERQPPYYWAAFVLSTDRP